MSDLNQNFALTSGTAENMSRLDLLEWVNNTVNGRYKKIEELCSGIAYCQMMELLFSNAVVLKKIKCNAKLEHEFMHNLKLFQGAFTKLNINKSVPIDRLIKGKFQDNFEFLQWFKKFFDTRSAGQEHLKVAAQNPPKPIRKAGSQMLGVTTNSASTKTNDIKTPINSKQSQEKTVSPSSIKVMQETQDQLAEQILSIELERNNYYKKLTQIETLLNEAVKNATHVEWSTRALNILYTDEGNTEAEVK